MKYPRTPHLPESPGGTRDDRRLPGLESFVGRPLVVTEKADGSNVCLERGGCYARSHGHAPVHPSFDALKALHARVASLIDPDVQVFGEWLYARHSLHYTALPGYLLIFGVRDTAARRWASWEDVELWGGVLSLPTVPVVARSAGVATVPALERFVRDTAAGRASALGAEEREGLVVRWADEFADGDFDRAVGKWVRENHVSTDDHWSSQAVVRNTLTKH